MYTETHTTRYDQINFLLDASTTFSQISVAAAMGDYGNAMMRNPDAGVQSRTKGPNRANTLQLKLVSRLLPRP